MMVDVDPSLTVPSIAAAADEWIAGLWARNHIGSPHTETAYRRDLKVWSNTIGDNPDKLCVEALDPRSLEAAAGELAKRYQPSTRRRMYATLSGFTAWCAWKGYLDTNPLADAHLSVARSRGQRLPKHVPEADLVRLMTAAAIEPSRSRTRWAQRDRALLAVLVGTGVRAAELCGLVLADVLDLEPPFVHVRGKGGFQRRIPLDGDVMDRLDAWLTTRERRCTEDPVFAKRSGTALFVSTSGHPLDPNALRYLIVSMFDQAGLAPPRGAALHGFRHTFAYRLVAAGVPLPVVQNLMGHRSMSTTSIYVRMTSEDSIRAISKLGLAGILNPTGRG